MCTVVQCKQVTQVGKNKTCWDIATLATSDAESMIYNFPIWIIFAICIDLLTLFFFVSYTVGVYIVAKHGASNIPAVVS